MIEFKEKAMLIDPIGIRHKVKNSIPLKIGQTKVGEIYSYQFHRYEMFAVKISGDFHLYQIGKILDIQYMECWDSFIITARQKVGYTSILMLPLSKKYKSCANLINQIYQEQYLELEVKNQKLYKRFHKGAKSERIYSICFRKRNAEIAGETWKVDVPFQETGLVGLLSKQIELVDGTKPHFRGLRLSSSFFI